MTNNQEPMLNQAATQAGLKAFSAAFVINAMTMDYYGSYDTGGAAVGTDAVDATRRPW